MARKQNKVCKHTSTPLPLLHEGFVWGVSFFFNLVHNVLMNILQKIFLEHYEEMRYLLHPRQSVIDNVDKMIHCGDPSYGGAMFGCPSCGELKFVPFRCHSRFCPTCGNKYSIDRTTSMSFKIINVQHRHCVFTIAEELRPFFLQDRSLLNCLFSAVRSVLLRMFHKDNKSELFTPGFICVLHTFGRDLKWNPSTVIKYIGRYLGRPVIATSRIDHYDGETVTFHYNRHEDEKLVTERIPVLDFIARLIQHIPETQFKMIRYYGLYARHRESDKKLIPAIPKEKHKIFLSFNRWRDCILSSFGYDPLKCPCCGTTMLFQELYFKHHRVPLDELYEKAIAKAKRCRSPVFS